MNKHILLAIKIDGLGSFTELSTTQISQELESTSLAWVHLDASNPKSRAWLVNELGYLDRFIVEALISEETRPRMLQVNKGLLINLRGINLNENESPEDMVSIRIWADEFRVISLSRKPLKTIDDIMAKFKVGKGPKLAGDLICSLAAGLFNRMEPFMIDLDERLDGIEEKLLEKAETSFRENIASIRKEAIIYKRYMAPQKDAIGQMRNSDLEWISSDNKRYLIEIHNHVTRYLEELDSIKERAQIVKDELTTILSDRLNKNMYILSIIAAIFLPLGFLTGLLGINVGGIPGSDYQYSFLIFCCFLTVVVFFQWIIFKKYKWL